MGRSAEGRTGRQTDRRTRGRRACFARSIGQHLTYNKRTKASPPHPLHALPRRRPPPRPRPLKTPEAQHSLSAVARTERRLWTLQHRAVKQNFVSHLEFGNDTFTICNYLHATERFLQFSTFVAQHSNHYNVTVIDSILKRSSFPPAAGQQQDLRFEINSRSELR